MEAGFAAEIQEELPLQKLWFVSRRRAGVSIEVAADKFEAAEQALVNWHVVQGGVHDAIRCPECGSFRVVYPQFTRWSLLTNLVMGLAAAVGIVEKDYYCEVCHYTWPQEGHRPQRSRPHMAPFYFIDGVEQIRLQSPQLPAGQGNLDFANSRRSTENQPNKNSFHSIGR